MSGIIVILEKFNNIKVSCLSGRLMSPAIKNKFCLKTILKHKIIELKIHICLNYHYHIEK